ncbi:Transcriptional regulator, AraC family protein [Minicystis rosea]|nr:Transcriptional regulator, AraC family protein [Minicystis rosea]
MSVVVEPLFSTPSVRAFRWTAMGPHTGMKESYAVGRVERGHGTFVVGGRRLDVEPRSLHLRQPGDVHRDVGREGPITLTVVSFAPRLVEDKIGPVRLAPVLAPTDPRGAALHRLLDAAIAGRTGLARDVAIAEALAALAPLDGPCTHTRAVRRALALLRARVAEPVTLDELAAHAGLDKFRLCRAFRAEVGIPPHAWLTALRVVRAKELLASGTAPRDVAPLVGFYDQSRLNQHFRRIVGTTPGRWVRELRA